MTILLVIIALSLLILVHELGHFLAAKYFGLKVHEFGFGFPPKVFSKQWGETEYSFNLLPLGGFVKIYGEEVEDLDNIEEPDKSLAFQPAWKKSVVILAGVIMNILLAWLLISGVFMVGAPEHLSIASVAENSPASEAELRSGDVVLEIQGQDQILEDPIASDEFIEFVDNNPGGEFTLTIQRGEEVFTETLTGRSSPPEGEGSLGVAIVDMGFEQKSFFNSFIEGAKSTLETTWFVTVAFVGLIGDLFSSSEGVDNLTGPVGIFILAKEAGALGLAYLMQLTAIISINLAVLNLIPFPALDGGRFVMTIIEKIKGSPIPKKIEMATNAVGFFLLIALIVIVTINDVGRFF